MHLKKTLLSLLLLSSALQASEKDELLNTSSDIVNQITTGIKLVGAATEYAHQGDALSTGSLSTSAHISEAQVEAYNQALDNFVNNYKPYGDIKAVLENKAMDELDLMDEAIGRFTEAVVDMSTVLQVNEKIEEAVTPQQEDEVQQFVSSNQEVLEVSQESVDNYNQSVDDIETHANNASAYLAVAGSEEAVAFLEQGIENANTTAEQTTIFYDANAQWVSMGYNTTRNLTAVFLNGNDNMGLDLYVTEADILALGSESEFFQTSPVGQGYNCFMYNEGCN